MGVIMYTNTGAHTYAHTCRCTQHSLSVILLHVILLHVYFWSIVALSILKQGFCQSGLLLFMIYFFPTLMIFITSQRFFFFCGYSNIAANQHQQQQQQTCLSSVILYSHLSLSPLSTLRYSYHHKLIPLLLTCMSDELPDIRNQSHNLWEKVC